MHDPRETRKRRGLAPRGFTLIELLVVLCLVSLLLGLGVGVYLRIAASLTPSLTVGRVKTLIRLARNAAVREGSQAVVFLDAKAQVVRATGLRTVAFWHCEDGAGAFGRNFTPVNGAIVPDGRIGRALKLHDGGYADCGTGPELDLREGVSLEAYVWPEATRPQTIARKGDAYVLGTNADGCLMGRVALEGGAFEQVVAEKGALHTDRFTRVGLLYNRAVLALHADGREVASKRETRRLAPEPKAPFLIGDRSGSFLGRVDEIRLREVLTPESLALPEEVKLEGSDRMLVFDASGKLDPAWHSGAERLRLRLRAGDVREVTVSELGTVQ